MGIKEKLGDFWKFLGKDSWQSWVVSIALAYLIVKFIFFPLLTFMLGTSLPLVVVESGSMSHPGGFFGDTFSTKAAFDQWWSEKGSWYSERGISKSEAEEWYLRTGMEKGDIIVVVGRGKINKGDIIIFNAGQKYPIIHRVIEIKEVDGEKSYSTKGDNNYDQIGFEKNISYDDIIGKAVFKIPKLGWLKLWLTGQFT